MEPHGANMTPGDQIEPKRAPGEPKGANLKHKIKILSTKHAQICSPKKHKFCKHVQRSCQNEAEITPSQVPKPRQINTK